MKGDNMAWKTIYLVIIGLISQAHSNDLSKANLNFGSNIFNEIGLSYDNIVFSPYSLHSALSMTSMGATDMTLEEMKKALAFAAVKDVNVIHDGYSNLIQSFNDTGEIDVLTGNAIFQNPKFSLEKDFQDMVMSKYEATAEFLNFSAPGGPEARVNEYVEEKTKGMIEDMISPNTFSEAVTKLVLVNTLFFNGSWARPFDTMDTKEMDFHVNEKEKKKVKLMTQTATFQVNFGDKFSSLRLPYKGDRFALYVVLPNNTDAVTNPRCLGDISPEAFFKDLKPERIEVYLPKFEINFKKSLVDVLKKLGMKLAFSTKAQFSKISPGTMISEVLHQAVIEVEEYGTKAAAATAVIMTLSANIPGAIPQFRADRPFLFYLRDDENKQILFEGKFSRPQEDPSAFAAEVKRTEPKCGVDDSGDGGDGNGAATLSLAWMKSIIFLILPLFIRSALWN